MPELTLKGMGDEEIARALEKRRIFKGYDLTDAIDEGDRRIAKAQLSDCQRQVNEALPGLLEKAREEEQKRIAQLLVNMCKCPPTPREKICPDPKRRCVRCWLKALKGKSIKGGTQ